MLGHTIALFNNTGEKLLLRAPDGRVISQFHSGRPESNPDITILRPWGRSMTDPAATLASRLVRRAFDRLFENTAAASGELVAVTAEMLQPAGAPKFGTFPDRLSPLQAADLATSDFAVEASPDGGRMRLHLPLSGLEEGGPTLQPQHVVLLNLLRLPNFSARASGSSGSSAAPARRAPRTRAPRAPATRAARRNAPPSSRPG